MGFTDMMSSARGPGLIGAVLGLIVLLGFGLLSLLVFDSGFQGVDQTIESVLRNQAEEIESLAKQVETGTVQLQEGERRTRVQSELRDADRDMSKKRAEIEWLQERDKSLDKEMIAMRADLEAYKDRYREHVRAAAKGTKLDRLATVKDEVFEQVTFRQINAIGIQIAHQDGYKRIPFEELPEEMKDYYQFCPEQKKAALAKENEHAELHERETTAAEDVAAQQRQQTAERERQHQKEKNIQLLEATEMRIRTLDDEIVSLDHAIKAEVKKSLSRAPQMRMQLDAKKREKTNLEAQANRLRAGQ